MYSFLGSVDLAVTEVLGVDEARQPILQPGPHTNALTRTAPIIEVLPHLTKGEHVEEK